MSICELFLGGHKWEATQRHDSSWRVCKRWWCQKYESTEPEPQPKPDPEPEPKPKPGPEDDKYEVVVAALYAPKFTIDGAQEGKLSVWRPTTSKNKSKVIWPAKYVNKVAWCTCFGDGFQEKMKRAFPNESSNRPRFYASVDSSALPASLYLRLHVVDNGQPRDIWTYVPNTSERMG